ncbi:MAG TPA: class I SAM-dependent rRNA methyltransferase [Thermoanaerobaculia bacterium]|nr:class I SAM-dependent rRNA methyltransferase [Thermoanaerobaculia bacterium]
MGSPPIPPIPPAIRVVLHPGREKSVEDGHPWLYSGAVARAEGPQDAPLARVFDAAGRPLGVGLYSPRSQIRVRLLTWDAAGAADPEALDRRFFAARLAEAAALRQAILPAETTGYRLVNAEGDGLPAWTVDRYGDVLVSQVTAAGLEALRDEAYAALTQAFPGMAILQSNDLPARRAEGLSREDEVLAGEIPAEVSFRESGLAFTADLEAGQKTGFYCDQRENRRLVERFAAGRTVLDLFAHSGAMGLYALRGGATRVVHVESSAKLIERGRRQYRANGVAEDRAQWVRANVFEELRQGSEVYDLVICDPPPLVRKRADLNAAARAYKDLNRLALKRLAPGGLFLTFSCSGAVDAKLFRQILFAAAVEAGVRLSLLAPLGAAPDHPVAVTHPQGEYLKGWLAVAPGPAGG